MTLVEFLSARLDEQEAIFEARVQAEVEYLRSDGMPDMTADEVRSYWLRPPGNTGDPVFDAQTQWPYILADIAAKRAIVAECSWAVVHSGDDACGLGDDAPHNEALTLLRILRLLAQPFAAHPDFDPAWRL